MALTFRKILGLSACAVILQACVSYYSPDYSTAQSTPATEADLRYLYGDAYDEVAPAVDISIADSAYYPWWSVDYYYLGQHYYRPGYWSGPRYSPRYSLGAGYGVPPHYWPYYSFYSPFYYPYSTHAWYDPWYGWPRYGIATNLFWQDVYWASRHRNQPRAREQNPVSSNDGINQYGDFSRYGDAFNDPRDRAGTRRPSRTNSVTSVPRVVHQSRSPQARPGAAPSRSATPRPPTAPRSSAGASSPDYSPGKRHKN
jgi:hypothetical protein